MKFILSLTIFITSLSSYSIDVKGPLIIVHPSRTWDPLALAKLEIEKAIESANQQGKDIYLLWHSDLSEDLFGEDKYTYIDGYWQSDVNGSKYPEAVDSYYINDSGLKVIYSEGGENNIKIPGEEFTIVGGYLEFCLTNALAHIIKNNQGNLTAHVYLPGVFSHKINYSITNDFNILDVWKYPTNPGFINLEKQVNVYSDSCPNEYFVNNNMVNYQDYETFGPSKVGVTSLLITSKCNGQMHSTVEVGHDLNRILNLNFFH